MLNSYTMLRAKTCHQIWASWSVEVFLWIQFCLHLEKNHCVGIFALFIYCLHPLPLDRNHWNSFLNPKWLKQSFSNWIEADWVLVWRVLWVILTLSSFQIFVGKPKLNYCWLGLVMLSVDFIHLLFSSLTVFPNNLYPVRILNLSKYYWNCDQVQHHNPRSCTF